MRNNKFTRFLAMLLAVMCLVSSAVVVVGAETTTVTGDNITDKSIYDYKETLDTISYGEYQAFYFGNVSKNDKELTFDLTDNWTFENGNIVITMVDGTWSMIVYDKLTYESKQAALEKGFAAADIVAIPDSERVRVIVERYDSLEKATAAKDDAGKQKYPAASLAYPTDDYDGVKAIYTPNMGLVTWKFNLAAHGINAATLVSIAMDYFPVIAKSSVIEREFYINGAVPFSESRSLSFAKIWSSYSQGSKADENEVILNDLTATYTLKRGDNLADIVAAAEEAGFVANKTYQVASDEKSITFTRPDVINPRLSAFIENYGLRFFVKDINNNEIRPTQLQDPEWTRLILRDSEGYSHSYTAKDEEGKVTAVYNSDYFGFVLIPDENGDVSISLDSISEPMALSEVTLLPYEASKSYEDYYKETVALVGDKQGESVVKLEAENNTHTSTNVVYPIEDRSSALSSPCDATRTLLNTIGGEKWATAGQWAEFSFMVDSSGWYDIYARFKQSYLDGMFVSRSLQVFTEYTVEEFTTKYKNTAGYYNGLPFDEANELRYDYGTDWQVTKLSNGGGENKPTYQLYFREGVVYTLRLEVTLGSMSDQVREIERILNTLNQDYLNILQLTGTSPDANRDYSFSRLLPDTLRSLVDEKNALKAVSTFLRETAGVASTYTGVCDKLVALMEKMVVRGGAPIAKNLSTFKSYVGSLGTFLTDALTQPLQLDYLMIQPATSEAPVGPANFFQSFLHEMNCFIQSFFRDYNSLGATEDITNQADKVIVWLASGRDQANVIRNLSTNGFTQEYDIPVDLKLVSGGTLLPSILAKMGPDVYLGLGEDTVINYAIRGALLPLEDISDDFYDVLERYDETATMVLGIADADNDMHYYGLPETQAFSMMFVRLDVLADLEIEIPKTWEEIYVAQSKLESNNMEIGLGQDYQMFLYQMGGTLWADDGMRLNLDSEMGLAAFTKMCELFTQYSFPYQFDGANRFRTGEMPIIIAGYAGFYNQLKVFATELEGAWTFVPLPGTTYKQADGTTTVNNVAISSVSAVVMIEGARNLENAWKYMSWYCGADFQSSYANEMVAIMGDSAKHSTANIEALQTMPWTYAEFTEISKQFDNLVCIRNYPGNYIIGRYTGFAFLSAYNDGADPSSELLSYINTINAEITRKRQEFGLETLELGQTLADKRLSQSMKALSLMGEKFNGDTVYAEAMKKAKYGIANSDGSNVESAILQLQQASDMYEAALLEKWDGKMMEITKVSGKTATVPTYYKNIVKQDMEKADGGFDIESLDELQLLYFLSEALEGAATALASYQNS